MLSDNNTIKSGLIPKAQDGIVVNFIKKIFGVPLKASGNTVIVTRDGEDYRFNGRKPTEGYTYYDRNDGNTYRFVNGRRTLLKQGNKQVIKLRLLEMHKKVSENKKTDAKIASTSEYGRDSKNTMNGWDPLRLKRTINSAAQWGFLGALLEGWNYMLNDPLSSRVDDNGNPTYKPNPENESFWFRHLGYDRNYERMPINGIRFTGDYNSDGSQRLPHAEYTGISNNAKNAIRRIISDGTIKVPADGSWAVREEGYRDNDGALEQLANFSIRENNGSGIYDIFDTYDFNLHWYTPNINRQPGTQIEVRDTIWGKHAIPELYDINFTKRHKSGGRLIAKIKGGK